MLIKTQGPDDGGRPPQKDDQRSRWDDLVADWKAVWVLVVSFFGELKVVLEAMGRLLLSAVGLGRNFARFLSRHSGWWLVAPLGAGVSSPATHGWGVEGASTLQAWSPVVLLPLLAIFVMAGFVTVNSHSDRRADEVEADHLEPELTGELAALDKQRQMADEDLRTGKAPPGSPARQGIALESDPGVSDIISVTYLQLVRSHSADSVVALLELADDGFELRGNKGYIDSALKEKLEMAWTDLLHPMRSLDHLLRPLGFRCKPFLFNLEGRHYLFAGIAGTELGDAQEVELSRAATDIVARYVYGDDIPGWMGATHAGGLG